MRENEEKLISKIRAQEDQALNELFNLYLPVVHKMMHGFYFRDFESADLYQEALIVCYRAALNYDHNKGSFGTYFKKQLQNHVVSLLRHYQAARRIGDEQALSLDALKENSHAKVLEKGEEPLIAGVDWDFLNKFYNKLSTTELMAFQTYLGIYTLEEVVALLAIEESKVKRAKARAYKKFLQEMQDK